MSTENKDEDELSIPRAALNKMIKELIPNIRVANDARELILNCCTEFIHLVSSEANEICNKQSKKTISPEHIIAGKQRIGTYILTVLIPDNAVISYRMFSFGKSFCIRIQVKVSHYKPLPYYTFYSDFKCESLKRNITCH